MSKKKKNKQKQTNETNKTNEINEKVETSLIVVKPKKGKMGLLKKILISFLSIILLVVILICGFIAYSTLKNGWGVRGLIQTAVGSEKKLEELEEFQTLILGISEDISSPLTDTIMVASYNPKTQKAVLLSIPRDTFIGSNKERTNSYDKINAVYQQRGAEGVLEKVNTLTGLNIKNYIVISNNALVELVDEIGGVEFNVPMDMDYDSKRQNLHIHLKAGVQKLDGEQAEWLVRFRKNNNGTTYSYEYGNDDYGRMKTQREFIRAVAKQTLQAKNITKIGNLIDIVKKNVTTNINDWDEIKEYIPYVVEFSANNIETATIAGDSQRLPAKTGLWFFIPDEVKTKKIVEELFTEAATSPTAKSKVKIEILNGSGNTEKLSKLTKVLKEKGYTITKSDNTSKISNTIIINKNNVNSNILTDIQESIKTELVQTSYTLSSGIDITIIIGTDYE